MGKGMTDVQTFSLNFSAFSRVSLTFPYPCLCPDTSRYPYFYLLQKHIGKLASTIPPSGVCSCITATSCRDLQLILYIRFA
jgi:hypothetical protein